jgi:hypothetical protein
MEIFPIEVELLKLLNDHSGKETDIYPLLKEKLRRNFSKDKGLKIQSLLVVLERRRFIKLNLVESDLLLMYHDLGLSKEFIPATIMAVITDEGKNHLEEILSNNLPENSINQKEVPQTKLRQYRGLL